MIRQVLRNTWLSRAIHQTTGIPVDPTLHYKTLTRTTKKFPPENMSDDTYISYALGTYAFSNGYMTDFCQVLVVRNNIIMECIRFDLTDTRKT
jgi:hypothetical protein